jgi:hypothetical protein
MLRVRSGRCQDEYWAALCSGAPVSVAAEHFDVLAHLASVSGPKRQHAIVSEGASPLQCPLVDPGLVAARQNKSQKCPPAPTAR